MSWFRKKKVEEVKEYVKPKVTEVYELTEVWNDDCACTEYILRKGFVFDDSRYVNRAANVYLCDLEGWQFVASGGQEWAMRTCGHYNIEVGTSKHRIPKEFL